MIKPLSLLFLFAFTFSAYAQTTSPRQKQTPVIDALTVMPYGQVDIGDLKMKQCDFEPDANAEVLFDYGDIVVSSQKTMKRHTRIKIFNDFGKQHATVKLFYYTEFLSGKGYSNIEAETINLEGDKIVKTPLESSQIYTEKINKNISEIIFTLPNVKAGSVIEFKYNTHPERLWNFQSDLPQRYSEVRLHFWGMYAVGGRTFLRQPLFEDSVDKKRQIKVLSLKDVHSLQKEPFMSAMRDNLQRVKFEDFGFGTSWSGVALSLSKVEDYDFPAEVVLPGQEAIINKANSIVGNEKTVAFVFDTVKSLMKWDGKFAPIPLIRLKDAWKNKTGNSTEINLILLHFLKAAGLKAYPTLVATKNFGTILPFDPDFYSINNTVITTPSASGKVFFTLDASNKYNSYNDVPLNILNTYGIVVDLDKKSTKTVGLEKNDPAQQLTAIDAVIQRNGKITGKASITSTSYHKAELIRLFDKLDQKTYIDSAFHIGNSLNINTLKFNNPNNNNDPLLQEISFTTDPGSTDNYIYINTNLFSRLGDNPFKKEERFTDVDLLFGSDYGMNGVYKLPDGYKIEALPRNVTVLMPDTSMMFKRTVTKDNGSVLIRYIVSQRKTIYKVEEYQYLRDFYKQMYELLNEQIVLKKQ